MTGDDPTGKQKLRIIKVNGVTVKVYQATRKVAGKPYDYFRICHYHAREGQDHPGLPTRGRRPVCRTGRRGVHRIRPR